MNAVQLLLSAGGDSSQGLNFTQRVWLQVEDTDAWVLATVVSIGDTEVKLKRLHAPDGEPLEVTVSKEAFSKLRGATGEYTSENEDLVKLQDVNDASMLHTRARCQHQPRLRQRALKACLTGP